VHVNIKCAKLSATCTRVILN